MPRVLLAVLAGSLLAPCSQALNVPLANPSFEGPAITPNPGSQDPADYVLPFIDGWTETGPLTDLGGFSGMLDTGVFINLPAELGEGVVLPPIPNAGGNQLAFMQVNTLADGVTEPQVSISQETAALFEAAGTYVFSIGIGPGVLYPPITDDPINNPATLVLSLGYHDPVGGAFVSVLDRVVAADELINDGIGTLTFVSVGVGAPLSADSDAIGNEVVVKVAQSGGTGGGFNLDLAHLALLSGDTDGDGDVDDFDIINAISNYTGSLGPGQGGKGLADGDSDGDQDVDDFDLIEMISTYTGSVEVALAAPVPEPGSVLLLGLGGMALVCRGRR